MKHKPGKINLLWLQSGGCGGCSLSLLNAESPDLFSALGAANIELLWHPSLSEQSGENLHTLLKRIVDGEIRLDLLCLEGSVILGPNGSGLFHRLSGSQQTMRDCIAELVPFAGQVMAIGNCAAYGGITTAGGNPGEACGLQYDGEKPGGLLGGEYKSKLGLPVINIAGCPPHPNWIIETMLQISQGDMSEHALDDFNRPRSYADHLVHHGCPRNEYYEFKASAEKASDLGCLMEHLGCLGTQAHADCNTRLWNGEGSCLRGGFSCINCTAARFEEPRTGFSKTAKIAGIPVGLPTDMPKAWFVALASLSKAATPARLKKNAHSDHIVIAPGDKPGEKS
ncbi:MAG: HupU protein [Proteobacteria bacterium]|nr:HupU protein [Pseudomonadota bacterium]